MSGRVRQVHGSSLHNILVFEHHAQYNSSDATVSPDNDELGRGLPATSRGNRGLRDVELILRT